MSEIDNPEGYPLAETWEDCARHVEAGGVVESFDLKWEDDHSSANGYLDRTLSPGAGGWLPRRLVPLPTPAPPAPHMVPSLVEAPEGAVLARWEDVKVGDEYKITATSPGFRRESMDDGLYGDDRPVWCWPAPAKPVTVEVDVELLRRAIEDCEQADFDAIRALIDGAS